jgi:hypothetical protein
LKLELTLPDSIPVTMESPCGRADEVVTVRTSSPTTPMPSTVYRAGRAGMCMIP